MSDTAQVDVEVTASDDIPDHQLQAARREIAHVADYTDEPLIGLRLALRKGAPGSIRPWVADASALFEHRVLAAHTTGRDPVEAAEKAGERLRRQLRRIVGSDVALRNEERTIRAALESLPLDVDDRPEAHLKRPAERRLIHRHPYVDIAQTTLEAAADLIDIDAQFHLFVHELTGEDVVIFRRDDGHLGLIYPVGSALEREQSFVIGKPDRYEGPVAFKRIREQMDLANHRWIYFIDAADDRGKVIYLRHDGDYGLVEPR